MKNVVQRLLDSEESAYSISKQTGVYASVIQRLRTGKQSIGESKLDNIEKLYQYQMSKTLTLELNADRYSQYKGVVKGIKYSDDYETKYKSLFRLNKNIAFSMRNLLNATGFTKRKGNSESALLHKMIDLLILKQGVQVSATEISGIFQKDQSIKYLCAFKKPLNSNIAVPDNVKVLEITDLDISSDISTYIIYFSESLDNLSHLSKLEPITEESIVQSIIDRIDDRSEVQ